MVFTVFCLNFLRYSNRQHKERCKVLITVERYIIYKKRIRHRDKLCANPHSLFTIMKNKHFLKYMVAFIYNFFRLFNTSLTNVCTIVI